MQYQVENPLADIAAWIADHTSSLPYARTIEKKASADLQRPSCGSLDATSDRPCSMKDNRYSFDSHRERT